MTAFSDKCKELIEEKNSNVYRLSKTSGLERTALQRMVNGSRIPGYDFVYSFCSALQLSKLEERHLLDLYELEKDGKELCQQRRIIMDLLENVQRNHQIDWAEWNSFPCSLSTIWNSSGFHSLTSKSDILFAAQELIKAELTINEDSQLTMNYSEVSEFVLDSILHLSGTSDKNFAITQYIDFIKNEEKDNLVTDNLKFVKSVIPFAFTYKKEILVYYSYVNRRREDNYYTIWPYYIATSNCVLQFSEDLKSGFLFRDKEYAKLFLREVERMKENYRLLFSPKILGNDTFDKYTNFTLEGLSCQGYILESHPCITFLLRNDWQKLKIKDVIGITQQTALANMAETLYQKATQLTVYFSMNDMERFMENGTLPGAYSFVIEPIKSLEKRKEMMQNFLTCIKDQSYPARMVRPGCMPLSPGLNLDVFEHKGLALISMSGIYPFCILYIDEKGILDAFVNFMQYVQSSRMVCSYEETVEELEQFIARY